MSVEDGAASRKEFLFAIADALHEEYQAIVDAGFVLQIDDPRLVTYYALTPGRSSTSGACGRTSSCPRTRS